MVKFTQFTSTTNGDPSVVLLNGSHSKYMTKTAAYLPEIDDKIKSLEKKAGKSYVLINAMTAGEHYGSNLNGDYFPDSQLRQYHKTFESHGHVYRHHINKDPNYASGKVVFAIYNEAMHRVELIVELDNERANDIIEKLEHGEFPPVSMGVRTPSDRCSVCNNRVKRTEDYCSHLKHEMNHVYPDGRKACAVNDDKLTFFDISIVRKPADRTASVLAKVANAADATLEVIPSAVVGEELLKNAGVKEADLVKEIEGTVEAADTDPKRLIRNSHVPIPNAVLNKLAEEHPMSSILSTFLGMRIMPTPMEFQRLILVKMNRKHIADECELHGRLLLDFDDRPSVPLDVSLKNFDDNIAKNIATLAPGVSLTKPLVIRRILMKQAEDVMAPEPIQTSVAPAPVPFDTGRPAYLNSIKNPLIPLLGMGGLFIGYHKLMNSLEVAKPFAHAGGFEQFLLSKPWLIPIVLGAAAATTVGAQHLLNKTSSVFQPSFLKRSLIAVPASYIAAGYAESKVQKGKQISELQDTVRKHPFLVGMAGTWGLGKFQRALNAPGIKLANVNVPQLGSLEDILYGLSPEKFEQFYNDVVGIK